MLKRCSEKKDMTEWNAWHEANPLARILLEGAHLIGAHLEGADLRGAHLEGADLMSAHLEGAMVWNAHLEGADLTSAHLEGADLTATGLQGADLTRAHLEGAELYDVDLRGADFSMSVVDGATLISACEIDEATDFTSVGLDTARMEPGLKQLLGYNIRRSRWRMWYRSGGRLTRLLKRPVRWFWWMSDYGRSTARVVGVFFGLAATFAAMYWLWPGLLEVRGGELRGLLHAVYFSVVTMTTLGFGDIHANPGSPPGQILLMVQVILGYMLLGALVTRFAVLFTAGGPAGKFAPKYEPPKKPKKIQDEDGG